MSTHLQLWEIPPGSIAVSDRLEGLDIYDALSEGVIDLDDLPTRERLTPEEQEADRKLNQRVAAQPDSSYTEF
jgi:hypothetical protein